jgi:hypothetical protein
MILGHIRSHSRDGSTASGSGRDSPKTAAADAMTPSSGQATPTTSKMADDSAQWSIEDVMRYVSETDSALGMHAELFRKHVSHFWSHWYMA